MRKKVTHEEFTSGRPPPNGDAPLSPTEELPSDSERDPDGKRRRTRLARPSAKLVLLRSGLSELERAVSSDALMDEPDDVDGRKRTDSGSDGPPKRRMRDGLVGGLH